MSMPLCILNVAEKPSVAKEVTIILSRNRYSSIRSDSQYNPVYEFDIDFRSQPSKMNFTSVTGHMMNFQFPPNYKDWKTVDPKVLLKDAPVNKAVCEDKIKLATNLKRLSKNCNVLVLWLDCDAEGEAIAFEVIEICSQGNRNLNIYRAHFSAVTQQDISHAFNNLMEPNRRLADSIEARQEIDLRIGASFTRFQTLTLRPRFSSLSSNLISYGPCQIPTLGFVVERYKKVKNFVPETFWSISCKYESTQGNYREYVEFSWSRNRLFDEYCARVIFEKCLEFPEANVIKVQTHPKSKWRPSPLNTIELQKLGVRKLHISSSRLMEIAEKLYNKGYISYPRTETDSFQKSINLKELIGYHAPSGEWGSYASNLLSEETTNRFLWPRAGSHNDNAHPPIHPVKLIERGELTVEEWKVYELITRHFLACCSQDAKGQEKLIEVIINEENFYAKGILITEYNYLEIYIYDKWVETNLPNLFLSQKFMPTDLFLKEGKTSAPLLLSEADLIATMDKNGIGTDATIHEHIKTIQERGYAEKINGGFFSPTNLGLALVESYEEMGLELAKPKLRADMEKKMKEIVAGRKNKADVVRESVTAMEEVYLQISTQKNIFIENVRKFYVSDGGGNHQGDQMDEERKEEEVDLGLCRVCHRTLVMLQAQFFRSLKCRECDILMGVPKQGELTKVNFMCPLCNSQIINVKTVNNTSYYLCPWCYSNPPNDLESNYNDRSPSASGFNNTMPCFKCPNPVCQYATGYLNKILFNCEKCGKGMIIKKTKKNNFVCSCSNYPACKNSAFLPDCIIECIPKVNNTCSKCRAQNIISTMVELKFNQNRNLPVGIEVILQMEPSGVLFCLVPNCDRNLNELGYQFSKNSPEEERKTNNNTSMNNRNLRDKENQTGNAPNKNIKCFKCQKEGHFSTNCTFKQPNANVSNNINNINSNYNNNNFERGKTFTTRRDKSNNNIQENTVKCFKCGVEGHYATNCKGNNQNVHVPPNNNSYNIANNFSNNNNNNANQNNSYNNRGASRANTSNDLAVKCFKCGKDGHYASTCSGNNINSYSNTNNFKDENEPSQLTNNNNKVTIKCFRCQQSGHYATNCPMSNANNPNNSFNNDNNKNQSYKNNNSNNFQKRVYNQIKPEKKTKDKKACQICGMFRHGKNSNCPGIKKRKKKDINLDLDDNNNISDND